MNGMLANVPCPTCRAIPGQTCDRSIAGQRHQWIEGVHVTRKAAWLASYDSRIEAATTEAIASWLEQDAENWPPVSRLAQINAAEAIRAGRWRKP